MNACLPPFFATRLCCSCKPGTLSPFLRNNSVLWWLRCVLIAAASAAPSDDEDRADNCEA